uniref:Rubisco LSMT substrate-binding domain-containing protein n=1 Tax=Trypanosoma congolense (strain IL3000) TaxID=1068625 RepID=G0UNB4_TRYCI|nr:conserved hypothetical protein [Trypanosoma congolense IL3000]
MYENSLEWFWRELDISECAVEKRFYFRQNVVEQSTASHLFRLLWLWRIIVADKRVVWEHISETFTESFRCPVDPWNEQLAVKQVLNQLNQMEESAASILREELHQHVVAEMKPIASSASPRAEVVKYREDGERRPYRIVPATGDAEGSIVCNAPLGPFAELLRVPRDKMFFLDTVRKHCDLGRVVYASSELSEAIGGEEQLLVLSLVYERFVVSTSHWKELLQACPETFPTVPAYWKWSDLAGLCGLDMLDDVLAKQTRLRQFHSEVVEVLPRVYDALVGSSGLEEAEFVACFSVENIMWARAVFDSRAFNLNIDGQVMLALVPGADMINHANRSDVLTRKVEPNEGDFVMQIGAGLTLEDMGRELWMSYGPLQNWELLQYYGFVLEENEHDKLPFPLDVVDASGETEDCVAVGQDAGEENWDVRRSDLINRYALHLADSCWIGYSGVPPPALQALLRIHLASNDEFQTLERHSPFVRVGPETEAKVISVIVETVRCIIQVSASQPEDTGCQVNPEAGTESDNCQSVVEEEGEGEPCAPSRNEELCQLLRKGLELIAHRTLQWCSTQATACTR